MSNKNALQSLDESQKDYFLLKKSLQKFLFWILIIFPPLLELYVVGALDFENDMIDHIILVSGLLIPWFGGAMLYLLGGIKVGGDVESY